MYCCGVEWCDFVVRMERDIHIERVRRDEAWWRKDVMPLLKTCSFSALLPELASPRQGLGGIREPVHMYNFCIAPYTLLLVWPQT